jgi:ribosomal-protein-serine acetyltransferase
MSFEISVDDELSLRLVEPHHAEELYEVIDANREHISRWLPWLTPGFSLEDEQAFTQSSLEGFENRSHLSLCLMLNGRLVGGSGWTDWNNEDRYAGTLSWASADIGYWIAQAHEGLGIITRAVSALTTHAFEEQGIRRLTIRAEPDNRRSWAVPERLGYTYEGTLRDVCRHNGRRVDHKLYSMLAEEWTP